MSLVSNDMSLCFLASIYVISNCRLSHLGWGQKVNDLIMKDSAKYVDKVLCGYTNTCLNYSVSLVNADGAHVTYSQMGKMHVLSALSV